jgi:hypothetical protein
LNFLSSAHLRKGKESISEMEAPTGQIVTSGDKFIMKNDGQTEGITA